MCISGDQIPPTTPWECAVPTPPWKVIGNSQGKGGLKSHIPQYSDNKPPAYICSKDFLLGLFLGELISRGASYWNEFCVYKWIGLDNKNSLKHYENNLKQLALSVSPVHKSHNFQEMVFSVTFVFESETVLIIRCLTLLFLNPVCGSKLIEESLSQGFCCVSDVNSVLKQLLNTFITHTYTKCSCGIIKKMSNQILQGEQTIMFLRLFQDTNFFMFQSIYILLCRKNSQQ